MVKGRKPNLKGANLARRILAMSNDDISDSKKRLIRWTVTEGTAESYDSKIKEIKSFAEVLGKNPVSFSTIELFLIATEADGYSASTGLTSACAWKFLRKLEGTPKFSTSKAERIQVMLDGWAYKGDAQYKTPRGVMDSGKLRQLVKFCNLAQERRMYAAGFLVAWQAMIRHGPLQALKVGDVRRNTDVGTLLWIARRKNFNRKSMKKQKRGQFKPLKNMKAVLDIWCNGREEKDVLFPGWDAKKACGIIRECSITHGWDQSVEWDGPHTERYGASRESELFQEDEINDLMMRKRADWGPAMLKKYRGY